jgi:hypothetical protein
VENYQQFYSHVHSTETETFSLPHHAHKKKKIKKQKLLEKGGENCSRRKDLNAFMFFSLSARGFYY